MSKRRSRPQSASSPHADAKTASIGGVAVNSSSSDTDFAADMLASLDVPLSNRLSLGAGYRFCMSELAGDLTAHVTTANATLRF